MYECQEVSNTALHNFPPATSLKSKKLEMRSKIKEKSLTLAGFEPTTSGFNWNTVAQPTELRGQAESRNDQNNNFITLFITHAKTR